MQQNKDSISYRAAYILLYLDQMQFRELVRDDGECVMVYNTIMAASRNNINIFKRYEQLDDMSVIEYLYAIKDFKTVPQTLRTKAHSFIFLRSNNGH